MFNLAVDCGPLTDPDNGQVNTLNGTIFGSTVTYTCHKESGSRTCGADGLWTSKEPNCQGEVSTQGIQVLILIHFILDLPGSLSEQCTSDGSAIVVSVIAVIWFVISTVIIVLLSCCLIHSKKQKQYVQMILRNGSLVGKCCCTINILSLYPCEVLD